MTNDGTRTDRKLGSNLLSSERINKSKYSALGGPSNPRLWRRMRGRSWQYYYRHD